MPADRGQRVAAQALVRWKRTKRKRERQREYFDSIWAIRGHRDAGDLCARTPERLVHSRLCRFLCAWFGLRISARRMAFWSGGSYLVRRGLAPLVSCDASGSGPVTACLPSSTLYPPPVIYDNKGVAGCIPPDL